MKVLTSRPLFHPSLKVKTFKSPQLEEGKIGEGAGRREKWRKKGKKKAQKEEKNGTVRRNGRTRQWGEKRNVGRRKKRK